MITLLIIVAMVLVFVFICLECAVREMHEADAIRDGLEVVLWDEKREKDKEWVSHRDRLTL